MAPVSCRHVERQLASTFLRERMRQSSGPRLSRQTDKIPVAYSIRRWFIQM